MSWRDRDYNRDDCQAGGEQTFRPLSAPGMSVAMWLLIINAVVFLVDNIFFGSLRGHALAPSHWAGFSVQDAIHRLQLWRFVTYQFMHRDLLHILFNMIGLYFFGRLMEQWWGSRRFLAFWLLCGIGGALLFTAFTYAPQLIGITREMDMVGASACVFGVLVGCAVAYPRMRVMLLIPPIPMSMRTMALGFLAIAAVSMIAGSRNAGGEAAHLGGAILGFVLIKRPGWLNWADGITRRARSSPGRVTQWRDKRREQAREADEREVNRILDKVKEHGLHSLTGREKRTLQRATDRSRKAG